MAPASLNRRIDASARLLLEFLERNKTERHFDYPFGFSYPHNCCESVSLILTYLIEEKYVLNNVEIIKRVRPATDERHYWVRGARLRFTLL